MSRIQLDNKTAHYREWGSGPNIIVMLHGWPADSTHYSQLGPDLAKLGYHIYVPDFPGWGNTPPPDTAWLVSNYRDWVHDFVTELAIKQFNLFGHSFGGRVAIKYAVKYSPDLKSLTLCASAGIKPDAYTLKRRALKLTASIGKKALSLPVINKLEQVAKKALYKLAGSNDYLQAEGVMKETIVNVLEEDLSPLLSQIHTSTLLLWGTEDPATPFCDGEKMHRQIKDSTLKSFEGAKHNLVKLIPNKIANAIHQHLLAISKVIE